MTGWIQETGWTAGMCLLLLLGFSSSAGCMGKGPKEGTVGGPCTYREYPGTARIVSVRPGQQERVTGGPSYQPMEVRFIFMPEGDIPDKAFSPEGKEYPLLLKNSWAPGPRFLEKYGIRVGNEFPCRLKTIVKGTCTPLLFEFPTIDLGDYFEASS